MNANEKLDWVLLYLSDESRFGKFVDVLEMRESWHKIYQKRNWATELERVIEHLEEEKYMLRQIVPRTKSDSVIEKFTGAWITFAGMVFIQSGGYSTKARRQAVSEISQTSALWLAAIGTALAGIYGIVELCKNYLPRCVPFQSLAASFLFGAVSVGLIWIVLGWLRRRS